MEKLSLVVTHPGGAHKDELLAVSVLIAKYGCPVQRREPSQGDLDDLTIAVVDVGGEHDASRANFDHHHFPREHPPTCALSLVLEGLGLYQDALQFCDWLTTAEWFDSRGPKRTAEWLGISRRVVSQLNSPIDVTLLRRFAGTTELAAGDALYEWMRFVGEDLVEYLKTARERLDFVAQHVSEWTVLQGDKSIVALFLPRTEASVQEPSASLVSYIRAEGLESRVAVMVYPDRRGQGYGISRYEDHPDLDFSQVEQEADVHFAHKSGFVCKTSAIDEARLRTIIAKAVVESV